MSIVRAFSTGFRRATSEPKMVLVLFVINILTAIPLAMAFREVLKAGLGSSMAPSELMEGMDFTVLADFMRLHSEAVSAVFSQIAWVMVLYMLVNTFLSGGILTGLRWNNAHSPISEFFSGCARYFVRFLRLFFLFVVVLVIVVPILAMVLALLSQLFTRNSTSEITDFISGIVLIILFLIPVMILLMIADYAKIAVVVNDETAMVKTAWRSTEFVFSHFTKTVGLELMMLLVPIVLFAIYMVLDLNIGMTTDLTIIIMLIIQQLFMASRAWSKVFFFAGEMSLYQSLQPAVYSTVEGAGAPLVTEPLKP
jgi:hypothetical protein